MGEEKLTPRLRFSGYNDVWEQRKIGECFRERTENMPDGELISVTINEGIKKFSELGRHDSSNEDKSKYKKVCVEDIAYNSMRMWQGASGYSPYEGIVSPAYTVLSPNEKVDSKCVSYLFKHPDMIHTFQINSQGITSDTWNLKYPALSEIEINLAKDIMEQKEIAAYFSNIDTLITLYQDKYDKLLIMKKAMLEKMFPRNGMDVPEIRFKGYTDPWEQRKVGDFLTVSRIQGHTGIDAKKLTVKLWGKGVVEKNDLYGGSANTQYYIRSSGQFMYGKLDFLNAAFGIVPESLDKYESTLDSPAFDMSGIDGQFLLNRVIQKDFYLKNGMIANGSRKAKRIHEDTFLSMSLLVPTYEEQVFIGKLFVYLDRLITLQQRKIEKLKNIKAGCLEKMFV